MNPWLDIHPEVAAALAAGRPVVALESTIISHGMPWPQNAETALALQAEVRAQGAVPATTAVLGGRLVAGLSDAQIDQLARAGTATPKASRRDLPVLLAQGGSGTTTVAATMVIAAAAGIRVFATGGIGGVHRGAATTMDISADLQELARTPVAVVCAGAKSILDLGLTLEYLETHGVPVLGYRTAQLPAFYTRDSGLALDARLDEAADIARVMQTALDQPWGTWDNGGSSNWVNPPSAPTNKAPYERLALGFAFTVCDLLFVVFLNDWGDRRVDALKLRHRVRRGNDAQRVAGRLAARDRRHALPQLRGDEGDQRVGEAQVRAVIMAGAPWWLSVVLMPTLVILWWLLLTMNSH